MRCRGLSSAVRVLPTPSSTSISSDHGRELRPVTHYLAAMRIYFNKNKREDVRDGWIVSLMGWVL